MIIQDLYIERDVENLILSMALHVELTTGIKFKTNKSDDLINLLRFAKVYDDEVTQGYFRRLGEATDSIAFVVLMRSLGIDLYMPPTKPSTQVATNSSHIFTSLFGYNNSAEKLSGKQKVIYRGQVTYI